MIKQGRLDKPYSGVMDCTRRTLAEEGITPFWRGNLANVIRYFPTQALNFAFKGQIKAIFNVPKDASYATKMSANIASGGCAGSLSLTVVYSLDYARTRLANDSKGKFIYCSNGQVSKIIIQVRTVRDNTMVSSMSTRRPSPPTVLPVSTEVSPSPVSVSSSTEVFTSVSTILSSQSSLVKVVPSWLPSSSVGLLLLSLVLLPTQLIPSDVV